MIKYDPTGPEFVILADEPITVVFDRTWRIKPEIRIWRGMGIEPGQVPLFTTDHDDADLVVTWADDSNVGICGLDGT
jgi:hypothetical protein